MLPLVADTYRINVRLDPTVRERLDRFQIRTHRNVTQSVNLLLDAALKLVESAENLDDLLTPKEH